jgi:PAS domain S-box-containing protein
MKFNFTIRAKIIFVLMALVLISSVVVGLYILRISQVIISDEQTVNISDNLKREAFAVISVTFFITAVISYFYAKSITAPIDKLIIGTQLVSRGQLDYKIKKRSNDEVGRLIDNFNRMIDNLAAEKEERTKYSSIAKQEKTKAELIIDSMAEGVIVTNKDMNVLIFNPSAEELFNVSKKKVLRKNIIHFLQRFRIEALFYDIPKEEDELVPKKRRFLEKSREVTIEVENTKKVIKAMISPVQDERKRITGAVIVLEDITKLKEIENLKTEFISTVSHELRTPLTCIKGYSLLLKDRKLGKMAEKQEKAIKVIHKESERLSTLVNDLLDLSKLEAGRMKIKKEEEDLERCILDSPALRMAKKKDIDVKLLIPKNLPKIKIDRVKITQVITNLVSNAVKFSKPKGKITIKISNTQDFIRVDVEDTGIGIAKKNIPKLFNKFYQVDTHLTRTQSGTGLGLAIVKEIIALHGGIISVESKPKTGTKFSFLLPKFDVDEESLAPCYELKNCSKTKCIQYNSKDPRCWTNPGTLSRKNSKKPCYDKINICPYCEVYKKIRKTAKNEDKKR